MSVEISPPVIPAVSLFRSINQAFFGQPSPLPAPEPDAAYSFRERMVSDDEYIELRAEEEAARRALVSDALDHGQR